MCILCVGMLKSLFVFSSVGVYYRISPQRHFTICEYSLGANILKQCNLAAGRNWH